MKNIAIIGSGIGGLTAGNLLAKKGHKVTIFEAQKTPGRLYRRIQEAGLSILRAGRWPSNPRPRSSGR